MCYYVQVNFSIEIAKQRFGAIFDNEANFKSSNEFNGFAFPELPIITTENKSLIRTDYNWGLLPKWTTDINFRKNTLNARIETVEEKPSFKNSISNRCLIIASGYYEWHWNDAKGKSKQKYFIANQANEIFAFAGIYDTWHNKSNDTIINSFSMLTTEANKTMEYVHNHKKRMPIILKEKDEQDWLSGTLPITALAYPNYDASLLALPIT